jgi:hypothetical protein
VSCPVDVCICSCVVVESIRVEYELNARKCISIYVVCVCVCFASLANIYFTLALLNFYFILCEPLFIYKQHNKIISIQFCVLARSWKTKRVLIIKMRIRWNVFKYLYAFISKQREEGESLNKNEWKKRKTTTKKKAKTKVVLNVCCKLELNLVIEIEFKSPLIPTYIIYKYK